MTSPADLSLAQVQHSYRLSSKPHLPPNERPATIVTSTGASIPLNQKRTVAREVVLDKGRAVHKVLEKEAMGDAEEVKVAVGQKEEWWALRILNTIVCLETLIATGLTVGSINFLSVRGCLLIPFTDSARFL